MKFFRGLLFSIPISLAMWAGLYLAWRWAFAWLGDVQ
jgi:hypothetical protein